jgi:hypothetical protein
VTCYAQGSQNTKSVEYKSIKYKICRIQTVEYKIYRIPSLYNIKSRIQSLKNTKCIEYNVYWIQSRGTEWEVAVVIIPSG